MIKHPLAAAPLVLEQLHHQVGRLQTRGSKKKRERSRSSENDATSERSVKGKPNLCAASCLTTQVQRGHAHVRRFAVLHSSAVASHNTIPTAATARKPRQLQHQQRQRQHHRPSTCDALTST